MIRPFYFKGELTSVPSFTDFRGYGILALAVAATIDVADFAFGEPLSELETIAELGLVAGFAVLTTLQESSRIIIGHAREFGIRSAKTTSAVSRNALLDLEYIAVLTAGYTAIDKALAPLS